MPLPKWMQAIRDAVVGGKKEEKLVPPSSDIATDYSGEGDPMHELLQKGEIQNPINMMGANPFYSPDAYAEPTSTSETIVDFPGYLAKVKNLTASAETIAQQTTYTSNNLSTWITAVRELSQLAVAAKQLETQLALNDLSQTHLAPISTSLATRSKALIDGLLTEGNKLKKQLEKAKSKSEIKNAEKSYAKFLKDYDQLAALSDSLSDDPIFASLKATLTSKQAELVQLKQALDMQRSSNQVLLKQPSLRTLTADYVQNTLFQGTTDFARWQWVDNQYKTFSSLFARTDLTPDTFLKALNDFYQFKARAVAIVGDSNFPDQSFVLQKNSNSSLQRDVANSRTEIAQLESTIPTAALQLIINNINSIKILMRNVDSPSALANAEKALQQLETLRDRFSHNYSQAENATLTEDLSSVYKIRSDKRGAHGGRTDAIMLENIHDNLGVHHDKIISAATLPELLRAIHAFEKYKPQANIELSQIRQNSDPNLKLRIAYADSRMTTTDESANLRLSEMIRNEAVTVLKQMRQVDSPTSYAKAQKSLRQLEALFDRYGERFTPMQRESFISELGDIYRVRSQMSKAHGGQSDSDKLSAIAEQIKIHRDKITAATSLTELHTALRVFEQFQAQIEPQLAEIKKNPSEDIQAFLSTIRWNTKLYSEDAQAKIRQKIKSDSYAVLQQMRAADSSSTFNKAQKGFVQLSQLYEHYQTEFPADMDRDSIVRNMQTIATLREQKRTEYGTSNITRLINSTFLAHSTTKPTGDVAVLRNELVQATTELSAEVTRIRAQTPRDQAALNSLEPKIIELQRLHAEYSARVKRIKGTDNDQVQQALANAQSTIADAYSEIRDHSENVRATVQDQTTHLRDLQSRHSELKESIFSAYKSADVGYARLSSKRANAINHQLRQLSAEIKTLETELTETHPTQRTKEQQQMLTDLHALKRELAFTKKDWAKESSLQTQVARRFLSEKVDLLEGSVQTLPPETPLQTATEKLKQLKEQNAGKMENEPKLRELPELLDEISTLANSSTTADQYEVINKAQHLAAQLLKFKPPLSRLANTESPQSSDFNSVYQTVIQAEKTLIETIKAVGAIPAIVLPQSTGEPLEPKPGAAVQAPPRPSV